MSRTASEEPRLVPGDLLSVPGLRAGTACCGLKPSGAPDLAVVTADAPFTAAGVFTRNRLPAAPVLQCREALAASDRVRTIVVNSGNANAMTGDTGRRDADAMARRAGERLGGPVLVLSTGVIGVPLPLDDVLAGIDAASAALRPDAGSDVAAAILTTDTRPKTAAARVTLSPGSEVTVGGTAKGSGMIHPDMATMLAFVATDATVSPATLRAVLKRGVDRSFHEITVDGDTSTNDAVLLLATGHDVDPIDGDDPRLAPLESAIADVMESLARQIVKDGEGASRMMELHVTGARGDDDARAVANAVATSSLVKTALAGGDPNWGRILAAAANAGVDLTAERMTLTIGGHVVYRDGAPRSDVEAAAVDAAYSRDEVRVELDLGEGDASCRRFTTDLTRDYVTINSEYTT